MNKKLTEARTQLDEALFDYMEAVGVNAERISYEHFAKLERIINSYITTMEDLKND